MNKGLKPGENGYSGYTEIAANLLKYHEIETVYVGGLATDYCVKATVLDLLGAGHKVVLLQDACRAVGINPADENKAIFDMFNAGAFMATTEEVLCGRP